MPAAKRDLPIEQGATWRLSLVWRYRNEDGTSGDPIDLTGWVGRMQIRKGQQAPVSVAVNSTLPDGGITLGGPTGVIEIVLTDDQTDLLNFKAGMYDLELEDPDGDVYRILQGKVTVDANITQEADDPSVLS